MFDGNLSEVHLLFALKSNMVMCIVALLRSWIHLMVLWLRMQEELTRAKKDSHERKSSPKLFAAIDDVERLIKLYVPMI